MVPTQELHGATQELHGSHTGCMVVTQECSPLPPSLHVSTVYGSCTEMSPTHVNKPLHVNYCVW